MNNITSVSRNFTGLASQAGAADDRVLELALLFVRNVRYLLHKTACRSPMRVCRPAACRGCAVDRFLIDSLCTDEICNETLDKVDISNDAMVSVRSS